MGQVARIPARFGLIEWGGKIETDYLCITESNG